MLIFHSFVHIVYFYQNICLVLQLFKFIAIPSSPILIAIKSHFIILALPKTEIKN